MRTHRTISRTGAVLVAGLTLVAATACGSSTSSEKESKNDAESSSKTASPSSTPSASPSGPTDEQLAKVVAGNPEDLTWGVTRVPASWKQLVKKPGELQWSVGGKCLLTLQQPGGLEEKEPTQDQIVADGIAYLERGTKVDLTQGRLTRRQFPVRSNLEQVQATTAVSVADFTGPRGVQGQVYAHRSGKFALVLLTVCSGGAYDAVATSDLTPFIDDLVVQAAY